MHWLKQSINAERGILLMNFTYPVPKGSVSLY